MLTSEQRRKNAELIDMKHNETVKRAVKLHNKGIKIGIIATELQIPESTVRYYIREYSFVR